MQGANPDSLMAKLLLPEIRNYLAKRDYKGLREELQELDRADIAEALLELEGEECAVVFRILPKSMAADVFEYFPFADQEELLHSLNKEQVATLLNEMDPDDRTALLEELPATATRRLIELLKPTERTIATRLLGYPEYSVGRRMTPEYVSIRKDWTVDQVLQHIRKVGRDKETVNILYVVDERHRLLDEIPLRAVILAEPEEKVENLMNEQVATLRVYDEQETAADVMRRYDLSVLPVIDSSDELVGIVTSDDVFDVVEEETTEDMHLMAGLEALEVPYSQTDFFTMIKKRAGWLTILFVGGTITAMAMEIYKENIIQSLMIFLPLIISSGGNSGAQASTLVIRALALQDIKMGDWYHVVGREILIGLCLGLILGILALLITNFFPSTQSADPTFGWKIAITVAGAVLGVVVFGTLTGCLLPFLLRAAGVDPALSSTPLVATLVDVMGVVIYFSVASITLSKIAAQT